VPQTVSREEWLVARKALLDQEKDLDRRRDALSAERRRLPRVKVDQAYAFDAPEGRVTLVDLFAGRRQLVVYHFMFDPSWDEGCKHCSFLADTFDGVVRHLAARDTSLVVISRAPLAKLEAFEKRMGWGFRWVSSAGSTFNFDYHVSFRPEDQATGEYNYRNKGPGMPEAPGLSVFFREGDEVFHTYSTYARGLDHLLGTYGFLDLTPLGRDEEKLPYSMAWVRHHDRYPG
jgi:predicted dithiol-disulfide oxidoreductase (DUF899 family)